MANVYKFTGPGGAFLGRNGYGKASGLVLYDMQAGTIKALHPITSKGATAKASIDIPVKDLKAAASLLAPEMRKAFERLYRAAQQLLDAGVVENHANAREFNRAVRAARKELDL